jgi:hypothetical protein
MMKMMMMMMLFVLVWSCEILTQTFAQSTTSCNFDYECNVPYGRCVINQPELPYPGFGLEVETGILYFISIQEPNVTFGRHVFRAIDLKASPKKAEIVGTVPQCSSPDCSEFYVPSPLNGVYGAGQGKVFWTGGGLGPFVTIFNAPINKLGTCSLNQNLADNCDGTLEILFNVRNNVSIAFPDPTAVPPEIRDCFFVLVIAGTRECPGNSTLIAPGDIFDRLILLSVSGKPKLSLDLKTRMMRIQR